MNLNIVTAASNSVGKAILERVANQEDITLGLSRKGSDIANALNVKVTDLIDKEKTREELFNVLKNINSNDIDAVKLFHNCCYVIAEIHDLDDNHPLLSNPKLIFQDFDGDGINDKTYHSLITTFRNVFDIVHKQYSDKNISIGTICSLIDKKKYIPTVFASMVKSNKILREEIQSLALSNSNIQSVCVSASTVRTGTEEKFRKYCTDKKYWVTGNTIADVLIAETREHKNLYKDIDVYTFNPKYNEYYKDETDEQMTERLKQEIGLI